ncbi:MAG: SAM-dependent methyltransferase [Flavobacterium sp. BFFFF1]|uniref:class I SAM-dependent methyltransferase n=1 Tax=unclassified Flavobacterium TaxID=196869 RepID=UPI000BD31516|nr:MULTISPECIES: class I SAM-dependent methyltransferase [unclassified Flavobacterium]OYU81323.1 MAG: SAM-dependent methyltransferase [Flavobacterium sp. BFFFF1]
MINFIREIIQKEKFNPGIIGLFINHNFLIRKALRKAIKNNAQYLSGSVIDFGCGSKPYIKLFKDAQSYIGVDYKIEGREEKQKRVDVFYDGKQIPFDANHFDSMLCTEVLEHVFNIDELLREFHRVLKPGAYAVITTPFMWEEHEMPYDFARYTTPALQHLYTNNGFEIVHNFKTGNYIQVIYQFRINYIKNILPENKIIRHLILLPFIFLYNLFGVIFSNVLPKDKTAYFNNVFILRKNQIFAKTNGSQEK